MHDELRERGVEGAVVERQALGRGLPDVDAGVPLPRGGHERLGRLDRRDVPGIEPPQQLGRERAGPAADVEHPLLRSHAGEVGELRRELASRSVPMKRSYDSAATSNTVQR